MTENTERRPAKKKRKKKKKTGMRRLFGLLFKLFLLLMVICAAYVGYVIPVSYTHLDVYKRQVYDLPVLLSILAASGQLPPPPPDTRCV